MTDLTQAQKIVAENYGGGDYAYMTEYMWTGVRPMLDDCGDGLFKFLMIELAATEGCESLEDAGQRIDTAMSQLAELSDKIAGAASAR